MDDAIKGEVRGTLIGEKGKGAAGCVGERLDGTGKQGPMMPNCDSAEGGVILIEGG